MRVANAGPEMNMKNHSKIIKTYRKKMTKNRTIAFVLSAWPDTLFLTQSYTRDSLRRLNIEELRPQ